MFKCETPLHSGQDSEIKQKIPSLRKLTSFNFVKKKRKAIRVDPETSLALETRHFCMTRFFKEKVLLYYLNCFPYIAEFENSS